MIGAVPKRDTGRPEARQAAALAAWFGRVSRPLPWRETYDPYQVWVSEAMLQQTRVETALPYFRRFIERFPTLQDLAGGNEEEVLRLWSGLGYYSRARNLRKAAAQAAAEFGAVPSDYDALMALPGVGRYMAGAVMSIAFNQPYPVVDGNVRRVLSRLHGWREPKEGEIWNAAEAMVAGAEPRMVNQGMMELGATLCSPRTPACGECPWRADCVAHRSGAPASIPRPAKRRATVEVELHAVIDRSRVGMLMRNENGLWEFPMFEKPPEGTLREIGSCRHTITHHRIHVRVYEGKLKDRKGFRRMELDGIPATALTRKIYAVATPTPA